MKTIAVRSMVARLALVSLGLWGCGSTSSGSGSDAAAGAGGGGRGEGGAAGHASAGASGAEGGSGGAAGATGGSAGATGGAAGAAGGSAGAAGGTGGAAGGAGGAASGGAGAGGGPNGQPSTTYPAPHPALPQIVNVGGPVLTSPHFYAVTFANDDPTFTSALEGFLQGVGATTYFSDNTSQYLVGAATAEAPISLTETSTGTIDDSAIQSWLAGKLNDDDPSFPTVNADTLFVIIYPAGTTVTASTGTGCEDFGSYHSDVALDSAHAGAVVPYVVLPRCTGFNGLTGTAAATATLSTALLNAVTDPEPLENPAWAETDQNHQAWQAAVGGGEICALCAQELDSFGLLSEIPYTAERCWSNAAAAAGHNPCVPAPSGAYFDAMPVLEDMETFQGVSTAAVKISPGASRTIAVDLFSDAATTGPISVAAFDYAASTGKSPVLELALDTATGLNGQHLNLTITVPPTAIQPAIFALTSTVSGVTHTSFGLAGN